jgi:acyl dehydratase
VQVDIDELKSRFLNLEFDRKDFVLDADKVACVAQMSGETLPQFCDTEHPDFQAPPAYIASLAAGRHLPIDFPKLGGIPMDGGKAVTCIKPVRAGEPLSGRTHLHDIYDKSGRSGRMIFLVSRMELFDKAGEHVATSDSRMVIRERPE